MRRFEFRKETHGMSAHHLYNTEERKRESKDISEEVKRTEEGTKVGHR